MKSLISTTTREKFIQWDWHNSATAAFWDACSKIKLNSHGKTMKTVLKGFGVYASHGCKKDTDLGCLIFKIRKVELTDISKDVALITIENLNCLKDSLASLGINADVHNMVSTKDGSFWGYSLIVPVAHISDIQEFRLQRQQKETA